MVADGAFYPAATGLRRSCWTEAQAQLASLSTNAVHRVLDASHSRMLEDPVPARQSADAIGQVVDAAMVGS